MYEENGEWVDEYDSYVPHIFRLALEGKDAERIAQSLALTRSETIGIDIAEPSEFDIDTANKIVKVKMQLIPDEHYT